MTILPHWLILRREIKHQLAHLVPLRDTKKRNHNHIAESFHMPKKQISKGIWLVNQTKSTNFQQQSNHFLHQVLNQEECITILVQVIK